MDNNKITKLVVAAQKGNSAALNDLFNATYNDIYYFVVKTLKNEDLACDITQETFVSIINNLSSLKEPSAFMGWAKKVAYSQCARYFNKKKEVLVEEDEDGNSIFDNLAEDKGEFIPDEALDQDEFKKTIHGIINDLSEEQRAAIMMFYFDEMSVKEIAEIQGVSEGTIKSRLNYGRKSIKNGVEDYEKEHNTKLHAIPFFPFFKWLFEKDSKGAVPIPVAASMAASISASTGVTLSIAGASAGASATAGAVAAAGSVGILAKIAALPLFVKITAAVLAVALIAVSIGAAIKLSNNSDNDEASQTVSGESLEGEKEENGSADNSEAVTSNGENESDAESEDEAEDESSTEDGETEDGATDEDDQDSDCSHNYYLDRTKAEFLAEQVVVDYTCSNCNEEWSETESIEDYISWAAPGFLDDNYSSGDRYTVSLGKEILVRRALTRISPYKSEGDKLYYKISDVEKHIKNLFGVDMTGFDYTDYYTVEGDCIIEYDPGAMGGRPWFSTLSVKNNGDGSYSVVMIEHMAETLYDFFENPKSFEMTFTLDEEGLVPRTLSTEEHDIRGNMTWDITSSGNGDFGDYYYYCTSCDIKSYQDPNEYSGTDFAAYHLANRIARGGKAFASVDEITCSMAFDEMPLPTCYSEDGYNYYKVEELNAYAQYFFGKTFDWSELGYNFYNYHYDAATNTVRRTASGGFGDVTFGARRLWSVPEGTPEGCYVFEVFYPEYPENGVYGYITLRPTTAKFEVISFIRIK